MSSPSMGSFFKPFDTGDGLSASIWAPKPQSTERRWLSTVESLANDIVDSSDAARRPEIARSTSFHNAFTPVPDEMSFGTQGYPAASSAPRKGVGAIGDGRQRSVTPEVDSSHVEQIFRSLNLDSPTPLLHPSAIPAFELDTTPDFSPYSESSALLTPIDLSPARASLDLKFNPSFDFGLPLPGGFQDGSQRLPIIEQGTPERSHSFLPSASTPIYQRAPSVTNRLQTPTYQSQSARSTFQPFQSPESPIVPTYTRLPSATQNMPAALPFFHGARQRSESWRMQQTSLPADWMRPEERFKNDERAIVLQDFQPRMPLRPFASPPQAHVQQPHDPINFLSLLHPSSSPPYHTFVTRIIKSSDQQASIFLQQKLKVADVDERAKIIDAICSRGFDMMAHRFGNWAVQRCLEATTSVDERRKIVSCMRGRVVDLAMNCYGCHVLQKALDCEEDIRLLIVSELLLGDPSSTLVNKHASHVWSKVMELSWTAPAPPIFAYVNKSLKGKWASLACHETGSLVVQHAFENLEESAKDDIVDELLNRGSLVFAEVAKSQWGSYCVQHVLEHGSPKHRQMTLEHLTAGLLEYATNEQGAKSVNKAMKEGGKDTLDRFVKRMAEPVKGGRRAMIVDLALSVTGSQLIANVLPHVDKEQRTLLYDSIRSHIVTLRGCKTGSKVIWLFDRMRAYYGY